MKRLTESGFTLIELICVITIIGLLASLMMPAMQAIRQRADNAACFSNLRQVGIAENLYIAEHDNTYPEVEPDPNDPIYNDPEVKGMVETLRRYGVTEKTVQCPTDLKSSNHYAKRGTSYEWRPMLDDENRSSAKIYGRRGVRNANPARVRQVFDIDPVHNGRRNVMYADGRVKPVNF